MKTDAQTKMSRGPLKNPVFRGPLKIHHACGEFEGADGMRLFYQVWKPLMVIDSALPALVFIHGMAEHSDRYQFPVQYFTERGYTAYAMDLRGHGKSGGRKAYADSLDQLIEDIDLFVRMVARREEGKKLFLIGHSFGGQLVLNYAIRPRHHLKYLSGIIVSSPNIRLRLKVPKIKRVLAPILSRYIPRLALGNELDPALVCRNEEVVQAYRRDKRVLKKITTRLANEILSNQEDLEDLAKKIRTPCLLMHAGDDKICCPEGTRDFFGKIPIRDKKLIIYDGFYHELFNERERERVFKDMEAWIEKKM